MSHDDRHCRTVTIYDNLTHFFPFRVQQEKLPNKASNKYRCSSESLSQEELSTCHRLHAGSQNQLQLH